MNKIELIDGAMGSEFIKRGITLPAHTWSSQLNIESEEIVYNIHKEYVNAGSNYLTTNTFRSTPRSYIKSGLNIEDAAIIAKRSLERAVYLAKKAAKNTTKILGSIAPLEDCYKPNLYPGNKIARIEFMQLASWFNNTNIDIFLLETMNCIAETETAIKVLSNFDKPIWVGFVLENNKNLLSGESLHDAINMIKKYNIDCLFINCTPIQDTYNILSKISNQWHKRWGIYPNLGHGKPSPDGDIRSVHSDEQFIEVCKEAINQGASIIGGCCGSTPYHINLLKNIKNSDK